MSADHYSDNVLLGVGISPGVDVGPVLFLDPGVKVVPRRKLPLPDLDREVERFRAALQAAEEDLRQQAADFRANFDGDEKHIFDTHLHFYQDEMFRDAIERRIRGSQLNAEAAILDEVEHLTGLLRGMDSLFRERQADIRDVAHRIHRALLREEQKGIESGDQPFVLYARELLPSHTLGVDRSRLLGIITELGGEASHVAILARAFGIPAVSGIQNLEALARPGTEIAVDGSAGRILLAPNADQRLDIQRERDSFRTQREALAARGVARSRGEAAAGLQVFLNIENFESLDERILQSTDGVGLYRTEFLFMGRETFPSEDEQLGFYRGVLERVEGREVTFRTIDVGGDKPLSYLSTPDEQNPVLGWRGVRLTFEWPDLLIPQLRALLRASQHGRLRILLPMVSTVEELEQARELLDRLRLDLAREGVEVPAPPLGVMIEVPAAAAAAEDLAREADFLSVGTNDLVQYFFAVDRNNLRVAHLFQPLHPAMLRTLKAVLEAGAAAGREVTVCGEMAGQCLPVLALLGLGLKRFSMSPAHVPEARLVFDLFQAEEAAALVEPLLRFRTEGQVTDVLKAVLDERVHDSDSRRAD